LGPEGSRPGKPTQAVRHTCTTYAKIHRKNKLAGRWDPLANGALCLSTSKHNGKSDTGFESPSGQTKDYTIDICCCSFKHTVSGVRSKTGWVGSTINIKLNVLT